MAYQSQCDYLGETHTSSLLTLANIGVLYGEIGDYNTAAMCEGKALEQMRQSWSEDNIYYIMGLSNFASIVRHLDLDGAENKSIDIEQKALDLKRQYLGQKHPTVITSLFNIAQYYVLGGRYDLSLPYYYDAIDLHKELYGSFNLDFLELMSEVWYVKLNNNVELNDSDTTNILFFCNNLMPILKRQFGNMRADLRNYYWTNASSLLDLTYLTCEEKKVEENIGKICAESAYNYALIRKGLLVNSVRNVNEILKDDSNEIRNIKQELDSMYAAYRNLVMRDITETSQTTQSLKNSIRLLENNLIKISNERGDFSDQMNMNYNSIKNVLKDGEIAIEFVKYKGLHDVIKYAALIITSDMMCPKFVPLFEAVELERLNPNQYYSDLNISHLIWEPLKEYLDDKATIYFSPDGELHNIAIEYVPFIKKSASLFDLFQVFRLTSTRELLNRDSIPPKSSATLFGDMDFNASIKLDDNSVSTLNSGLMNRGLKNELMKRAGFTRLLATKVEVDSIQKIITPYVSRIHTYMGASATEGAFKNLSDTECAILHIATHGVYWDKEAFDKADLKFGCESEISSTPLTYVEDKAMTRSALLFSGANNTVKNGSPNSFDDGILSAYEISQLDLTKLDLAILSACQTGLGEISGDGVFGLQRGFKIAGTKSLLMSLWEVDDEATSLLMIEFYRNYLKGYSKRESLLVAQKTVRETPGFEDPEYWAAFILLDALN